jgi:hypothetical protein
MPAAVVVIAPAVTKTSPRVNLLSRGAYVTIGGLLHVIRSSGGACLVCSKTATKTAQALVTTCEHIDNRADTDERAQLCVQRLLC